MIEERRPDQTGFYGMRRAHPLMTHSRTFRYHPGDLVRDSRGAILNTDRLGIIVSVITDEPPATTRLPTLIVLWTGPDRRRD